MNDITPETIELSLDILEGKEPIGKLRRAFLDLTGNIKSENRVHGYIWRNLQEAHRQGLLVRK